MPEIPNSVYIAPTAVIDGEVSIDEKSSVWFGAVVRGDGSHINIGSKTNIQDNAVIHCGEDQPAKIGERVSVGHGAVFDGAETGNDCIIGINSTILNNVKLSDKCIVAAGAVVTEGKRFGPKTLLAGVPAKKIGEISERHIDYIKRKWKEYLKKSSERLNK